VLTWLMVGVAAYVVFLAGVIVVLRAAKARGRAERAMDVVTPAVPGAFAVSEMAGGLVTSGATVVPPMVGAARPVPEGLGRDDSGRGHPVAEESMESMESPQPDPGPPAPPSARRDRADPPSSRSRG
jgi:hypothetical protein